MIQIILFFIKIIFKLSRSQVMAREKINKIQIVDQSTFKKQNT